MIIYVTKKKYKDVGSCNFCNRGQICDDTQMIVRPYEYVYDVSGEGALKVRFCKQCLKELKNNHLILDIRI